LIPSLFGALILERFFCRSFCPPEKTARRDSTTARENAQEGEALPEEEEDALKNDDFESVALKKPTERQNLYEKIILVDPYQLLNAIF